MRKSVNFVPKAMGLLGLTGLLWLSACSKGNQAPTMRAPTVSVVTVSTRSVPLTTELSGRTVPYRVAEIRPRVNGLILKRLFEEGGDVKEGQVLFNI